MARKSKTQKDASKETGHSQKVVPQEVGRSPKEERLYQNLLKTVQQFIQGKGFSPMTEAELFTRLSLAPQHEEYFKEIVAGLVKQGVIESNRGRFSFKQINQEVVTGTMRMHPRGFGFLQADNSALYPQDIFIPKHLTQNAVDGDKVEVEVNKEVVSEKGPEGRVVTILSRSRTHMAGIIREAHRSGELIAYVPLLGAAQRVVVEATREHALKAGDRVVMEVLDWGAKNTETVCRFSHYLGHISDPSCDISAAIEEYELRSDFSHHVIEEAKSFGLRVSQKEIALREDLRDLECFTIDPDSAKDFDDALTLTKDKRGKYHLGVHIADVSHYVRPGTALDEEAKERCNSTYFPRFCLPMLPSVLSDNLCSLKPNVNRLTASVFMDFDSEGTLINYRIARTVIKSAKRFTYREAKEVLDGKKASPHSDTLHLMVELCGLLKKKRYERGSVEFALPELVIVVDEQGMPYKTDYIEYDVTHQLVEEFMLKANETVATHLANQGKNLTYRIHDVPAEENLKDFSLLAGAFGFQLPEKPTPADIQRLFDEALETSYGPYLATSYIRRMRLAAYSADNIGHYGLSLTHYCHFTSPIRRYVDLVSHRILFGENDNRADLEKIAADCSDQERISAKAEGNVVLRKKLRLLEVIHKQDETKQFEAVVTRIKPFGIYFEVLDFMLEGFLHISELGEDYYIFEEAEMRLRGKHYGAGYTAGDKITVMVKTIDLIVLESEWHLVGSTVKTKKAKSFQRSKHNEQAKKSTRHPGKAPSKVKSSKGRSKKH